MLAVYVFGRSVFVCVQHEKTNDYGKVAKCCVAYFVDRFAASEFLSRIKKAF